MITMSAMGFFINPASDTLEAGSKYSARLTGTNRNGFVSNITDRSSAYVASTSTSPLSLPSSPLSSRPRTRTSTGGYVSPTARTRKTCVPAGASLTTNVPSPRTLACNLP